MRLLLLLLPIVLLFGPRIWRRFRSGGQAAPPTQALTEGDDWHDLPFRVLRVEPTGADGRTLYLLAAYGPEVSLSVHLSPEWLEGTLGDTGIITHQGVVLITPSPNGDAFVTDLDQRYGTALSPYGSRPASFTAISLEGHPGRLDDGPTKIKLFFDPDGDESTYAEAYLNIDLGAKQAEFAEKDPDYRANLVRAFAVSATKQDV